jgi:hypothetical protein
MTAAARETQSAPRREAADAGTGDESGSGTRTHFRPLIASDKRKAYIVSVGGFLGMGTRYVAIDPKAVTLTRQDEKTWKATMNANKDQLRAAPEYKYESEWRKR